MAIDQRITEILKRDVSGLGDELRFLYKESFDREYDENVGQKTVLPFTRIQEQTREIPKPFKYHPEQEKGIYQTLKKYAKILRV